MEIVIASGTGQVKLHVSPLRQRRQPEEGRQPQGQHQSKHDLPPLPLPPVDPTQQAQVGQQEGGE